MKITIEFTQDETQALKNWSNQVKPPNLDEKNFYKQIFFNGIGAINQQLTEMAKSSLKDETVREQLRQSGVDVEKLEQELFASENQGMVQPAVQESLEKPATETTDPAAPVEVLPDGEQSTKTDTTQDATDTK